jgi:transposase-like protein
MGIRKLEYFVPEKGCRRHNGAPRFRCRACKADFSITNGTLFASHKLPLRG